MKRVIIENTDGTIGILIPAPEALKNMSIDKIIEKDVPGGLQYEVVEDTDIPTDRFFRNAWEHDKSASASKVNINIPKAKDIAHVKRRKDRDEAFKPLDIEATIPSQAQAAEAARQAIRDADATKQTAIDNATNEEELRTALGI